jgi:histone deacetylase HOS2
MKGAPSVQMSFIPPDILGLREDTEKEIEEETAEKEEMFEEREGGGSTAASKNSRRRELERGAGQRGELFSSS